ncbi:kekkon 5 [Carabus blaptoides fortunei]
MSKIVFVITLLFNIAVARQCFPCNCFDLKIYSVADCSRHMNRPQLTSIPDIRIDVNVFSFDAQQLSKLSDYIFVQRHLTQLNTISMSSCSLETVEKYTFAHLYKLEQLSLSNNKLTKLDISTFSTNRQLQALHLYNNQIEIIQNGLFDTLTSLKRLDLRNNSIRRIEQYVFKNNHALEYLDLSDNQLKTLDSFAISQMLSLRSLFLTANPWICDCKLSSLFEVTTQLKTYVGFPQCAEPETQIGNLWSNMSPNDFKCWLNISLATSVIRVVDNNTIVTLSCKINSFPAPAVLWNYGSVHKYSISFSMESPFTYWSNLTIIGWTIEDYGQYVCAARNYELTEEKFIDLFAENLPFINNQTTTSVSMSNEGNISSTTEILEHNDEKYLKYHIKNESSTIPNHIKVTFEKETVTGIIVTAKSEVNIRKHPDNIEDLIDKVLELENKTTSVNITEFIRYSSRSSPSINLEQGQNLLQNSSVPEDSELYAIREATS